MHKFMSMLLLVVVAAVLPIASQGAVFLQDMSGEFHDLKEYTGNGKWLVVMLWASDCQVCNQEAHQYELFHNAHKNKDAQILGISADGWSGRAEAQAFITRHKVTFPNLIAAPDTVAKLFAALTGADWRGTPTFLFFNPKGELVAQQVGAVPTPMIEDFMAKETQAQGTPNGS